MPAASCHHRSGGRWPKWKLPRVVYKIRERKYAEAAFPIKIRPYDDELLSSWLIRLALEHRTMPTTFTNLYLPETKNKLWASDLDLQADTPFLDVLSYKSALPMDVLRGMALRSYETTLFEQLHSRNGGTPFILPLRMRGRYPTAKGLRFCPYCLREDEQPYFRKKWRLSFSTACLVHKRFLVDACGRCGAPVSCYKRCRGGQLTLCNRCGYDLRRCSSSRKLPGREEGLEAIRWLYEVVDNGYVMLGEVPVYGFLFFRVLHHLWKVVCVWEKDVGVLGRRGSPFRGEMERSWDRASIKAQYRAYGGLASLFQDYPDGFMQFCGDNALGKTELTRDMKGIPFWYIASTHNRYKCCCTQRADCGSPD